VNLKATSLLDCHEHSLILLNYSISRGIRDSFQRLPARWQMVVPSCTVFTGRNRCAAKQGVGGLPSYKVVHSRMSTG
jgi:hypothetical protein